MARRLVIEISESVEYLEKSLRQAQTGSQKEKLQVLWWLKSGQVTQHQDLSHRLGRNGSTISRWLQQYRRGGLSALLETKPTEGEVLDDYRGTLSPTGSPLASTRRLQELSRHPAMVGNVLWSTAEVQDRLQNRALSVTSQVESAPSSKSQARPHWRHFV